MDSLAVFSGKPFAFVYHPGMPVHLIGTFLLGATYPLFPNHEAFIQYYISGPEKFFFMTHLFLFLANILTIIVFYKIASSVLEHDKIFVSVSLSLMYFSLHSQSFDSITYWSHNSFSFIFGTLWLLWLYWEFLKGKMLGWKKIVLLGWAGGILSMNQLYLLALLLGGIVAIFIFGIKLGKPFKRAVVDSLLALVGGMIGSILMLIPAYHSLPALIRWLIDLLGHQGLYGSGEKGIYSLLLIPISIAFWLSNIPILMVAIILILIILGAIAYFAKRQSLHVAPSHIAMAIGLLVQMFLLIFVLSKMFYRLRYMLSLAALLPVLFLVTIKLLESTPWKNIWVTRFFCAVILCFAGFFFSNSMISTGHMNFVEREAAIAKSQTVSILAKQRGVNEEEIVVVYAFGTPIKCAGLLAANNWLHVFDEELSGYCPNQYAIHDYAYDMNLHLPYSLPTIEKINWDLVVWPGNGSDLPEYLNAVGARNIPKSWGITRVKWFFIHPDTH